MNSVETEIKLEELELWITYIEIHYKRCSITIESILKEMKERQKYLSIPPEEKEKLFKIARELRKS